MNVYFDCGHPALLDSVFEANGYGPDAATAVHRQFADGQQEEAEEERSAEGEAAVRLHSVLSRCWRSPGQKPPSP